VVDYSNEKSVNTHGEDTPVVDTIASLDRYIAGRIRGMMTIPLVTLGRETTMQPGLGLGLETNDPGRCMSDLITLIANKRRYRLDVYRSERAGIREHEGVR